MLEVALSEVASFAFLMCFFNSNIKFFFNKQSNYASSANIDLQQYFQDFHDGDDGWNCLCEQKELKKVKISYRNFVSEQYLILHVKRNWLVCLFKVKL